MIFINRLFLLSFLSSIFISAALFSGTAKAEETPNPYEMSAQKASIPQESANNGKDIIIQQLKAISERDAQRAYTLMSDHSHETFEDAQDFLASMRFDFGPIYNHMDVEFLHHYESGETSVHKLSLKDRYSNESYTVIYKLEQQNDGKWLIDSFTILDFEEAQPI